MKNRPIQTVADVKHAFLSVHAGQSAGIKLGSLVGTAIKLGMTDIETVIAVLPERVQARATKNPVGFFNKAKCAEIRQATAKAVLTAASNQPKVRAA